MGVATMKFAPGHFDSVLLGLQNPSVNWTSLIDWFQASARPLPWRRARRDAYETLVSEMMSQQSVLSVVIPYFENWMRQFPNVAALAAAQEEDVLKAWAGLGYYSRVRALHKTARLLVKDFSGSVPVEERQLQSLPGVGPYTAAAVNSFVSNGFGFPVDANVRRVLARLLAIENPKVKELQLWGERQVGNVPRGVRPRVTEGLIELGALICKPADPRCEVCPLATQCRVRVKGLRTADYPAPSLRAVAQKVILGVVVYRDASEKVLVRKIPAGARLGGQWELPNFDAKQWDWTPAQLKQRGAKGPVSHAITRFRYAVYVMEAGLWRGPLPTGHAWLRADQIDEFRGTVTTLTIKALKLLERNA